MATYVVAPVKHSWYIEHWAYLYSLQQSLIFDYWHWWEDLPVCVCVCVCMHIRTYIRFLHHVILAQACIPFISLTSHEKRGWEDGTPHSAHRNKPSNTSCGMVCGGPTCTIHYCMEHILMGHPLLCTCTWYKTLYAVVYVWSTQDGSPNNTERYVHIVWISKDAVYMAPQLHRVANSSSNWSKVL